MCIHSTHKNDTNLKQLKYVSKIPGHKWAEHLLKKPPDNFLARLKSKFQQCTGRGAFYPRVPKRYPWVYMGARGGDLNPLGFNQVLPWEPVPEFTSSTLDKHDTPLIIPNALKSIAPIAQPLPQGQLIRDIKPKVTTIFHC